ncbi:MAG: hypothetical protein J6R44_02155, partial [Clostridia bacterium]|nr:hypothetical protein [Clostridia bacterium]
MRRISVLIVVLVLAVSFAVGIAVAGRNTESEVNFTNYEVDYADQAVREDYENGFILSFDGPTTFNTIVLKEEGSKVTEFSIYYTDEEG